MEIEEDEEENDEDIQTLLSSGHLEEFKKNGQYYFMKYLSNFKLDKSELEPLRIMPQTMTEKQYIRYYHQHHMTLEQSTIFPFKPEDRILDSERIPEMIRIRGPKSIDDDPLMIVVENRVYVVYYRNKYTGEPYVFNLEHIAICLSPYGVEYSTNKFAKVTHRYLNGPSHLFFFSGAMLETGTYSTAIARKSLNNTLDLLKVVCKYDNIEVGERICENIVAKGTLKFELCLLLLKDTYPSYVQYNPSNVAGAFVGAIIRLRKVSRHQKNKDSYTAATTTKTNTPKKKRKRDDVYGKWVDSLTMDEKNIEEEDKNVDEDEDDDEDEEEDDEYDDEEEEEEEEDDEEIEDAVDLKGVEIDDNTELSAEDYAEYEFLEVNNEDDIYNSGFEYYNKMENMLDDDISPEEMEAIRIITSTGNYNKKKRRRGRGGGRGPNSLVAMVDPNEIDNIEQGDEVSMRNITVIVFDRGRTICAGCKTSRGVKINCAKVREMVITCKKTPKNLEREKELREARNI